MPNASGNNSTSLPESPLPEGAPVGPRELVVMTRAQARVRALSEGGVAAANADVGDLRAVLDEEGVTLTPLFGPSEERVRNAAAVAAASTPDAQLPDLTVFYAVEAPDERLDDLAKRLLASDVVEAAFVKPAPEPASLNEMVADPSPAPPVTPDFTSRQGYLQAAPGGVDALFAHGRPGGRGNNVRIVDVEGAWRFSHEDLVQNQGGLVAGTPSSDILWRDHGTAVIGEFSGDSNGFGVTGICPDATVSAVSIFGPGRGSARAITDAANRLRAGDILLIELHAPGPRLNFQNRRDQRGYIAMEWWPDNLAAIQFAVGRGVIVVEAAGNGAEDLDDAIYDTPAAGFPASWTNPFRRGAVDSGAIVVGAGAPPSGRSGPDRSRLDFSNYGALVDAQGWGREVVTTGYGDLQGGMNEDLWYTAQFSGTSSASPIVVGTLGCLQGMVRAAGRPVLTPAQARAHLRATGSPQQAGPGAPLSQRIGNRPNLRALHDRLFPKTTKEIIKEGKEISKELRKEGKEVIKDIKDRKDAKEKEKDKEKEASKEVKDRKDLKEKERKEFKEFKEKDIFEGGGLGGGFGRGGGSMAPEAAEGMEETISSEVLDARLAQVEMAVLELSHFISGELRPDLLTSALSDEDLSESGESDE